MVQQQKNQITLIVYFKNILRFFRSYNTFMRTVFGYNYGNSLCFMMYVVNNLYFIYLMYTHLYTHIYIYISLCHIYTYTYIYMCIFICFFFFFYRPVEGRALDARLKLQTRNYKRTSKSRGDLYESTRKPTNTKLVQTNTRKS